MSLPRGRKRKVKDGENAKLEASILSDTNEDSNSSKKLKVSEEITDTGTHECFCCKQEDTKLTKCSLDWCGKFYHSKCLEDLPSIKTDPNLCPLHICLTCYNINPKNSLNSKGHLIKCGKCPVAFHDKDTCMIPGVVISSSETLCPKHFGPEKNRNYRGIRKLPFCVECGCNQDLVFCKSCPAAIHIQCMKIKVPFIGEYRCDRCRTGKTVLFSDIVWAKVFEYRWWPAMVIDPDELPEEASKMQHFDGEFPVKCFGTEEYYWIQMGRVYPFFYRKINVEAGELKHNVKKIMQNPLFDEAVQLALEAMANQKFQSVDKNTSNKKPPPFKYVKCNKPIGNVQVNNVLDVSGDVSCGCNPEDKNPCGYNSTCLNRSMFTECYEDFCEAGPKCQNLKFQKAEYVNAKPYWTDTRGWGLKLLEDIKKGTFIGEYCGDLIDEEEMNRRVHQKQLVGDTNFYFCTLDSNRIIDAGPKGCITRFMNHSCDPNCESQKWMVLGDARVGIFAKRDIKAGSELTFDYQMDFSHFDKLKCNCGSKRCAGLIGKKLKNGVSETGEQNAGHSSSDGGEEVSEKSVDKVGDKKQNGKSKNGESKTKKKNGDKSINNDIDESKTPLKSSKKSTKLQNGSDSKEQNVESKIKNDKNGIRRTPSSKTKKSTNENGHSKDQNGTSDDEDFKLNGKPNKRKKNASSDDEDFKITPKTKKQKKSKPVCFKCKTGGKMIECSVKKCSKLFHVRCLAPKWKPNEDDLFECPSHFCKKCKSGSVYQCFECPNAYCEEHVSEKSDSERFACPKHCD